MRISIIFEELSVIILARAGGGRTVGDAQTEVNPGEEFLGWTYDELIEMGQGGHDIQPKKEENK